MRKELFPGHEKNEFDSGAQGFPQQALRPPLACCLVEGIGQFKYLVTQESQQSQQVEIEREKLGAVPKIVREMIPLVFERVETLIFDFPPTARPLDQVRNGGFLHGQVCHPRTPVGAMQLPVFIRRIDFQLKIIDEKGILSPLSQ